MAEKTISIRIIAQEVAAGALDGVKEKLGGINLGAIALGGAAATGVGLLAKSLWDAGQAAATEEVGIAKMAAAVKASGADWDIASGAIEGTIAALRRKTALDDGDAREAISRLTTTTHDYTKALDLLPLALDLATAKDMDLKTAAELVGRVAEGNTGILSRYGIVLDEGASATDALRAMQETFGGQAEEFGRTYEGQNARLQGALGDLKETIGGLVLPIMTQFAEAGADLAQRAIPILEQAITDAQPIFENVFGFIQSTVIPILSDIVSWVEEHWPEISAVIGTVLDTAWEIGQKVFFWFRDDAIPAIKVAYDWIMGTWPKVQEALSNPVEAAQRVIERIVGAIQGVLNSIRIPHIPTPHITVHWQDLPILGRIPSGASVDWYAGGLDAVFSSPTLIGVGEAGPERVRVTPLGKGDPSPQTIINFTANYRERQEPETIITDLRLLLATVRS